MFEKKEALIWLIVLLVVSLGFLQMLAWVPSGGYMQGMMSMRGMMGYGWWFMPLIPIVFLVLIALGAYYLIAELAGHGRSEYKCAGRSLEILMERYAKGEVTREQYLKMKEELES